MPLLKRPFWAALRVRHKFGAQRRIAQGRLCRPRALKSPKGGGGLGPPEPKKKDTPFSVSFFLEATPGFEPGNEGFADPCLTTWLCHQSCFILCRGKEKMTTWNIQLFHVVSGAGDGARTRYLHLGKVALYQMSYARIWHSPIKDWTVWCLRSESNQRHEDFQSSALPTELQRHIVSHEE